MLTRRERDQEDGGDLPSEVRILDAASLSNSLGCVTCVFLISDPINQTIKDKSTLEIRQVHRCSKRAFGFENIQVN